MSFYDEEDDYSQYNDDTVHNMWVDYTAQQHLGYNPACDDAPEDPDDFTDLDDDAPDDDW